MRIHILLAGLLCPAFSLFAQKPLAIGDKVPGFVFNHVQNHSSSSLKLSDYKGRLVVLDFWATWCTSCLHSFPKMDSLQRVFGDQLKVLLIDTKSTRDDSEKVKTFFTKWEVRTGKKLSLPSVVMDTIADRLFPHQLIPHYVWISREGRVLAFSSAGAVTAANIRTALDGKELSFTMKKDQDAGRPLFSNPDIPVENLLSYSILVKGWFDGLPSGNRIREKEGVICGRNMTNTSLLDMYFTVARNIDTSLKPEQFIVITKDSSELFAPLGSEERSEWYKEHAYSLDVIVPPRDAKNLFERMLEELNRSSGYTGKFERKILQGKEVIVFVLKKSANFRE